MGIAKLFPMPERLFPPSSVETLGTRTPGSLFSQSSLVSCLHSKKIPTNGRRPARKTIQDSVNGHLNMSPSMLRRDLGTEPSRTTFRCNPLGEKKKSRSTYQTTFSAPCAEKPWSWRFALRPLLSVRDKPGAWEFPSTWCCSLRSRLFLTNHLLPI